MAAPAFLGAFDFGLLALAGPRIADAVGATGAAYPWLFSTSSFAYGACVIPAAAVTARLGPARALRLGLTIAPLGLLALAAASAARSRWPDGRCSGSAERSRPRRRWPCSRRSRTPATRRSAAATLGGAVGGGFAAGALLAGAPSWRAVLVALAAACLLVAARRAARHGYAEAERARLGAAIVASRLATTARGRAVVPGAAPSAHRGSAPPRGRGSRRFARRRRPPRRSTREPVRGSAWLAFAIVVAAFALALVARGRLVGLVAAGALAVVGLRRASSWLPRLRAPLVRACARRRRDDGQRRERDDPRRGRARRPGDVGCVARRVRPGGAAGRAAARCSSRGGPAAPSPPRPELTVQAAGLAALAAAFALDLPASIVAPAIVAFGIGHVAANAGAAGAVAGVPGPAAVGALLVAAQYLGGGIAPVLIVGRGRTRRSGCSRRRWSPLSARRRLLASLAVVVRASRCFGGRNLVCPAAQGSDRMTRRPSESACERR